MLLTSLCTLGQHDERIVNGAKVDLASVHEWFGTPEKGRKGARPLEHWRRLFVEDVEKQVSREDLCLVRTEDGTQMKVLLAHPPREIREPILTFNKLEAEQKALRSQIADAESKLAANTRASVAARRQVASLRQVIGDARRRLRVIGPELGSPQHPGPARIARNKAMKIPVFAMFTGRQQGNLPIWDTGVPNSAL